MHVGPGPLGLGRVVRELRRLPDIEIGFVARPGSEELTECEWTEMRPRARSGFVTVDWASGPSTLADLPEPVRSWIGEPEPLLVTTALGDQAPAREKFLSDLLSARSTSPTTLVVCKNQEDPCYRRLREGARAPASVCASVVDRVSVTPEPVRDMVGRRRVLVHPTWEWVVRRPADGGWLAVEELQSLGVRVVDDLSPYEDRKRWIVNGIHLVLALVARLQGSDFLAPVVQTADFARVSAGLADSMLAAHAHTHPAFTQDASYAPSRVQVFADHDEDRTKRILEESRAIAASTASSSW